MVKGVELVEVGPRDGFQSIGAVIPTERKLAIIDDLHACGLRRMEATAFVSPKAVPQMADAAEVMAHAQSLPGLDVQVLVPNERQALRALEAGARHIAFFLSVSEAHNRSNVRRAPAESVADYARMAAVLPADVRVRINIATAFHCPFGGRVDPEATLAIVAQLLDIRSDVEIALCDTTGRVTPRYVAAVFQAGMARFQPRRGWAFHAHDTFGLGAANSLSAYGAGVRVFDGSVAGLGGCPFAPGATGNVASEDLAWMFEGMSEPTGLDLAALVRVAEQVARLPGACVGGRVREALAAAASRTAA